MRLKNNNIINGIIELIIKLIDGTKIVFLFFILVIIFSFIFERFFLNFIFYNFFLFKFSYNFYYIII